MANPLRPELTPTPPLSSILSRPSVGPSIFQQPSHLQAIIEALRQTPNPGLQGDPSLAGPGLQGDQALTAEDYQNIGVLGNRMGSAAADIGSQVGGILGRAAQERIQSQIPQWFKDLNAFDIGDYMASMSATGQYDPTPGSDAATAVPTLMAGSSPVGAPAASGGVVPAGYGGRGATPGIRQGYGPTARPGGSISDQLTRPDFADPDFSESERLMRSLNPGTAPNEPTQRDIFRAGVMNAALGAASAENLPQALALAGAGMLQGRAAESNAYLDRLERFEAREQDTKLKKIEIGSNLEIARRNFDLKQEEAINQFEQTKAQIQIQELTLRTNESLRRAELMEPYIGIAGNRFMIADKRIGANGQVELVLPPKTFVINEVEDQVSQILAQAQLAQSMGNTTPTVVLSSGGIKTTFKDQQISGALAAGQLWLEQNMNTPEGRAALSAAQEEIRRRNPMLENMKPDEFERAAKSSVIVSKGIGMLGQAASGRGAVQFNLEAGNE